MDTNFRAPAMDRLFRYSEAPGPSVMVRKSPRESICIKKVGPGALYLAPCSRAIARIVAFLESDWFDHFLKAVREKFDFTILDAPPLSVAPESRILCARADGVVLVVRSGKTRVLQAQRAKKAIEESGTSPLGVVLNRRTYYIPHWIYRRLYV